VILIIGRAALQRMKNSIKLFPRYLKSLTKREFNYALKF